MQYNKLVRDKIVGIIETRGETVRYHIANDAEYRVALREKLREETEEFVEANNIEEMADVFEVIDVLIELNGWNPEEIRAYQKVKRQERGGFSERIILDETN